MEYPRIYLKNLNQLLTLDPKPGLTILGIDINPDNVIANLDIVPIDNSDELNALLDEMELDDEWHTFASFITNRWLLFKHRSVNIGEPNMIFNVTLN